MENDCGSEVSELLDFHLEELHIWWGLQLTTFHEHPFNVMSRELLMRNIVDAVRVRLDFRLDHEN